MFNYEVRLSHLSQTVTEVSCMFSVMQEIAMMLLGKIYHKNGNLFNLILIDVVVLTFFV